MLPGAAEIEVVELRRGNNQTNLAADARRRRGVVLATATAVLVAAARRRRAAALAPPPPPTAPWRELPVLASAPPLGPLFAQHYEYRAAATAFAPRRAGRSTASSASACRSPRVDAPALVGRLDAWWPTLFALDGAPRPVATISFTAEILVDPATLPPDEPLRHRARLAALHDGFFVELRELWSGERVVALNQQTFAILPQYANQSCARDQILVADRLGLPSAWLSARLGLDGLGLGRLGLPAGLGVSPPAWLGLGRVVRLGCRAAACRRAAPAP